MPWTETGQWTDTIQDESGLRLSATTLREDGILIVGGVTIPQGLASILAHAQHGGIIVGVQVV